MNLIARIFSIILQPIFIPLYGVILLTEYDPVLSVLPLSAKSLIWLIVFLSTGLFPAIVIGICIKYGMVSDTFISNRKQRPIPFIFTLFGYFFCVYWLHKVGLNLFYTAPILGAAIGLMIMLPINYFWKISAHLSAMGGLCGGLFTFAFIYGTTPIVALVSLIILSGILGWSRMELKAHTLGQVCCGWLNGFLTVTIVWLLLL
jgi:hypothetical protein